MSKPPGIAMGIGENGLTLSVTRGDRVQNKIWDAVDIAVNSAWSVEMFRQEAAAAWDEMLRRSREDAKHYWNSKL